MPDEGRQVGGGALFSHLSEKLAESVLLARPPGAAALSDHHRGDDSVPRTSTQTSSTPPSNTPPCRPERDLRQSAILP